LWIAQSDTDKKPGDGEKSWRLAVKKGRDGRDGKDGKNGEPGRNGKDLTRPPYVQ
jgi:collagen type III alpha